MDWHIIKTYFGIRLIEFGIVMGLSVVFMGGWLLLVWFSERRK